MAERLPVGVNRVNQASSKTGKIPLFSPLFPDCVGVSVWNCWETASTVFHHQIKAWDIGHDWRSYTCLEPSVGHQLSEKISTGNLTHWWSNDLQEEKEVWGFHFYEPDYAWRVAFIDIVLWLCWIRGRVETEWICLYGFTNFIWIWNHNYLETLDDSGIDIDSDTSLDLETGIAPTANTDWHTSSWDGFQSRKFRKHF